MKLKEIEGTPEEIGKICTEQNFSLNDYLHDKPKIPIWVILTFPVLFLVGCCILWVSDLSETFQRILFLLNIMFLGVSSISIHLKYKQWTVSFITAFIGLIMLSVSLNLLTPEEAIKTFKEKLESSENNALQHRVLKIAIFS
jgi:hypothetical protein